MAPGRNTVRVKICGLTCREDALAAVREGAHALGFVFHPSSPRYVTPREAASIIRILPPFIMAVGVFVNRPKNEVEAVAGQSGIHAIQLHGNESPEESASYNRPVIKAFRCTDDMLPPDLTSYRTSALLVESRSSGKWGGSGVALNWEQLSAQLDSTPGGIRERLILAGGLDPGNVARAVSLVRPAAVDVSSGVEESPGKKSEKLIKEFMYAVQNSTGSC
jgi:phosphoribosylanthranilate isomerase